MQKPIEMLTPNLSKPVLSNTSAASSQKDDAAASGGIGNPFSHLFNRFLKSQSPAKPAPTQPGPNKNTKASTLAQPSESTAKDDPTGQSTDLATAGNEIADLADPKKLPKTGEKPPAQELVVALTENIASTISALPQDETPITPTGKDMPESTAQPSAKSKSSEPNTDELTVAPKPPTAPSVELLIALPQPMALGHAQPGQPDLSNTSPVTRQIQPVSIEATAVSSPAIQTLAQGNLPGLANLLPFPGLLAKGTPNASKDTPLAAGTLQASTELPRLTLPTLAQSPGLPQSLAHGNTTPLTEPGLQTTASNHQSLPLSQPATSPSQGGADAGPHSLQPPLPGTGLGTSGLGTAEMSANGLTMPAQPIPSTTMKGTATDYAATLGKIQSHMQAMGGTLESSQSPQPSTNKPQEKPQEALRTPASIPVKPEAVSLAQSLHVPKAQNQEQNTETSQQVGNISGNATASSSPSAALDGTSHTLLHGLPKAETMKAFSDKPADNDLDDAGAALQTDPAVSVPDSGISLGANGLLPSSSAIGTHQATDAGPGGQIPQFSSASAHPAEQVADGTVYSVKNGHKELIIRLNPDNLGEVRINLTSHGNQELSARMIATTKESHDLLKSQMDTLKQSLESQGIQVDRLSVVMAGSAESQTNTGHEHRQGFQHETLTPQTSNQSHSHNQDHPNNPNTFGQMHSQFQHKQGFSQSQFSRALNGNATPSTGGGIPSDASQTPDASHQDGHSNGRVSILV